MKDITAEDWIIPKGLTSKVTKELSRRAGHIPQSGDILLSRFKEPLGKSLLYLGAPTPLIANTNFLLLRTRPGVSPFLILGLLKSSFLARQLHLIIRRKSLIAEMSRHEAELIRFPALPPSMQLLIANTVEQRVSLQNEYRQLTSQEPSESTTAAHRREVEDTFASIDLFIDEVICSFLGIGNSTARLNNS